MTVATTKKPAAKKAATAAARESHSSPSATAAVPPEPTTPPVGHLNQVQLRGRLAAAAERVELPSGDILCTFRLVVDRPAASRGRVDCIDCASAGARVRQILERAETGELIEISGQLRRRFWRGPTGPTSRYEVEVTSASRTRKAGSVTRHGLSAGRRTGSSPAPKPASV